jgi:hypothetical protein
VDTVHTFVEGIVEVVGNHIAIVEGTAQVFGFEVDTVPFVERVASVLRTFDEAEQGLEVAEWDLIDTATGRV